MGEGDAVFTPYEVPLAPSGSNVTGTVTLQVWRCRLKHVETSVEGAWIQRLRL